MKSILAIITFGLAITLAPLAYAGEVATFGSFYVESSTIGWTLALGAALVAAGIIFATGGTASPLVAWLGTSIGSTMGLSGAAATNTGLAVLGGGSIASGGLGILGGTAILSAVLMFSTDVMIDYSVGELFSNYNYNQFVEDSKKMTTLPVPKNEEGPKAYENAFKTLGTISQVLPFSSNESRNILEKAQQKAERINLEGLSDAELARVNSLLALISFQKNDYSSAKTQALVAIGQARMAELRRTLPAFIYATSMLYVEDYDFDKVTNNYFRHSILAEPENKLIPLLYAIYLDRMVYRIYDGFLMPQSFQKLVNIAEHDTLSDYSFNLMALILTRHFVMLKDAQQRIGAITTTSSKTILNNPRTVDSLHKTLERYNQLLDGAITTLDSMETFATGGEEKDKLLELFKLYNEYALDQSRLQKAINDFIEGQVTRTKEAEKQPIMMLILIACLLTGGAYFIIKRKRQ